MQSLVCAEVSWGLSVLECPQLFHKYAPAELIVVILV
jgi:hypothetical protein